MKTLTIRFYFFRSVQINLAIVKLLDGLREVLEKVGIDWKARDIHSIAGGIGL
jgi:hypothetical protein